MKTFLSYFAVIILFTGCTNKNQKDMTDFYRVYGSENERLDTLIECLANKKVYFGHQSVGFNIINGIIQLAKENDQHISIAETRDFAKADSVSFVHFRVGENRNPYSKIDDFVQLMDGISKDSGSIAFFKFCYIDISKDTDIDPIFKYYKEKMIYLKEKYPQTKIILVTMPIRALQKGIKAFVKKMLTMPVGEKLENVKRIEFNERLINELSNDFQVFDLAKVEATLPDGTLNSFEYQGNKYFSMPYLYTRDQGHLNDFGARVVATNLISFLTQSGSEI